MSRPTPPSDRTWAALAVALMLGVSGVGCSVDLDPLEGKACDAEHPCPQGYRCRLRQCTSAEVPPPPSDDAGIRWHQVEVGFTGTDSAPGAEARVDAFDGNRFVATIGGPPADRAIATVERAALPQSDDGYLRGTLRLRSQSMPQDVEFSFFDLQAGPGQSVVELYFVPSSRGLGIRSMLRPNLIWNGFAPETYPPVAALFVPDRDNVLEVRWKRNQFVEIYVNDAFIERFDLPPDGLPPGAAFARGLRLGVPGCGGCAPDAGLSLEYRDWRLSGDADADLGH